MKKVESILIVTLALFIGAGVYGAGPVTTNAQWNLIDSIIVDKVISAGGSYVVYFDHSLTKLRDTLIDRGITQDAETAVSTAPLWIRMLLVDNFRRLSISHQNQYANIILNPSNPNYLDEICFQIAHLSPQTLEKIDPALIDTNVAQAYRVDKKLKYVDIIDFGTDSSTTKYLIALGSDTTWVQIPAQIYYWFVIMPKLVMERPKMGSSVYNRFWRDYLWNTAVTDTVPGENLHLKDVLPIARIFWDEDSARWENKIDFDTSQCALEIIGKWVGKVIPRGYPPGSRPNQPNIIANNHKGTCSELRMLSCAAGRTGLIPVVGTWNWNENHHWNEVWWNGEWHPYQVNYWNGPTYICMPKVMHDKDYGGNKELSLVWNERADGMQESVIKTVSHSCTVNIEVTDTLGNPVDGCKVMLESECESGGNKGIKSGTTDRDGKFTFVVGNSQNYYLRLESSIGNYPSSGIVKIVNSSEATTGSNLKFKYSLPGHMPHLDFSQDTYTPDSTWKVKVVLADGEEAVYGYNNFYAAGAGLYYEEDPGWYRITDYPGKIDFFITDATEFTNYLAGNPFKAYKNYEDTTGFEIPFVFSANASYYFIFSNKEQLNVSEFLPIKVYLYHITGVEESNLPSENSMFQLANANPNRGENVKFRLAIKESLDASLKIYDIQGKLIRTLVKGRLKPDIYTLEWDGLDDNGNRIPQGLYFCQLKTNDRLITRKQIRIR